MTSHHSKTRKTRNASPSRRRHPADKRVSAPITPVAPAATSSPVAATCDSSAAGEAVDPSAEQARGIQLANEGDVARLVGLLDDYPYHCPACRETYAREGTVDEPDSALLSQLWEVMGAGGDRHLRLHRHHHGPHAPHAPYTCSAGQLPYILPARGRPREGKSRPSVIGLKMPRKREPVRLDLGCGNIKQPGFVGADRFPMPGVDVVLDLNHPLPIASNSIDLVLASHSLEHVDNLIFTMQEIYRICRDRAQLCIVAPYYHQALNLANPYHRQCFNEHTPRFWSSSPVADVDQAEYFHPHALQWGLSQSDHSDPGLEFYCLRMEFFYFPEYRDLPPEQRRAARHKTLDVCDQVMYHLLVLKSPITDEELRKRAAELEYCDPRWVCERRYHEHGGPEPAPSNGNPTQQRPQPAEPFGPASPASSPATPSPSAATTAAAAGPAEAMPEHGRPVASADFPDMAPALESPDHESLSTPNQPLDPSWITTLACDRLSPEQNLPLSNLRNAVCELVQVPVCDAALPISTAHVVAGPSRLPPGLLGASAVVAVFEQEEICPSAETESAASCRPISDLQQVLHGSTADSLPPFPCHERETPRSRPPAADGPERLAERLQPILAALLRELGIAPAVGHDTPPSLDSKTIFSSALELSAVNWHCAAASYPEGAANCADTTGDPAHRDLPGSPSQTIRLWLSPARTPSVSFTTLQIPLFSDNEALENEESVDQTSAIGRQPSDIRVERWPVPITLPTKLDSESHAPAAPRAPVPAVPAAPPSPSVAAAPPSVASPAPVAPVPPPPPIIAGVPEAAVRVLTRELDAFRERRVVRWLRRFSDRLDLRPGLPSSLRQLDDDSLLFHADLGGFRLQPSRSLQAAQCIRYDLPDPGRPIHGLLLSPLLEVTASQGTLQVTLRCACGTRVAQARLAAASLANWIPAVFQFSDPVVGEGHNLRLEVTAEQVDVPVRLLEWRRYRWRGLGRVSAKAFCGFVFSPEP